MGQPVQKFCTSNVNSALNTTRVSSYLDAVDKRCCDFMVLLESTCCVGTFYTTRNNWIQFLLGKVNPISKKFCISVEKNLSF